MRQLSEAAALHHGSRRARCDRRPVVTLRGSLHILKFTTLLGVSVHAEPQQMAGALVEATGILRLWDVPASCISPFDVEGVSRTGRFFSLQDPEEPGHAARVVPIVPDR
ncbi:MAG: hypothetical protein U1F60_06575 [Planctomycetota bacterium]